MRRSGRTYRRRRREDHLLLRFLRFVCLIFSRLYHRLEVRGRLRLPETGGAILVCNHTSGLDPLLIQATRWNLIIWMMDKEFYDIPALNWIVRAVAAIPVARKGRDFAATRKAIRMIRRGYMVGIFPEGRIEKSRELLPFQVGVALLAFKTGAPVYPAYLDGTQRNTSMQQALLRPNHARLTFGPEVELDRSTTDKRALVRATHKIQSAVQALMDATPPVPERKSTFSCPARGARSDAPPYAPRKRGR